MKINKKNILHWVYLVLAGVVILLSLPLRAFKSLRRKPLVVLYGHKLNGNLKAFYDYCKEQQDLSFELVYLTMDPAYYRELRAQGVDARIVYNPLHMLRIGMSEAMITSHGYHVLYVYYRFTNMKFIDVRHGIPYKGYTHEDFADKLNYTQEWLSSEYFKNLYIKEYGFREDQIRVTGFARVDRLVLGDFDRKTILNKYDLKDRKTVLLAPTWAQDEKGRSIVPFDTSMEDFFDALEETGRSTDSTIIFRAHLNTGDQIEVDGYEHVVVMPYTQYPVVEEFLYIADLLITDWSSIAIDYLALKRPTIFLDVPSPFAKGFTLGPEHRYGEVVGSARELNDAIKVYIDNPQAFIEKYDDKIKKTEDVAYGGTLDGRARERYLYNLIKLLKIKEGFSRD